MKNKEFVEYILNEFEILTLREGLFLFIKSDFNNLTEKEFKQIDDKIKAVFK